MKTKYRILAGVFGLIIFLDQLTKTFIREHFKLWEQRTVIPGAFDLTYAHNTGAAFSFLAAADQHIRVPFFFIVPLVAMIIVLILLKSAKDTDRFQAVALSLVFSGAVGNYIDRLRFRYVIDFLDFHWKEIYHYPSFNVADSAICVGVGLLILQQFLGNKKEAAASSKVTS